MRDGEPQLVLERKLQAYGHDADDRRCEAVEADRQANDLIAIVDRQVREHAWTYGILYDLRAVHGATPKGDLRRVADRVLTYVTSLGSRGSVALVTRTVDMVAAPIVLSSALAKRDLWML